MVLNAKPVSISREINNNLGTASYEVEYTDDVTMSNTQYTTQRNLELTKKGNVISIGENGSFTSYLPKGEDWMDVGTDVLAEIPAAGTSQSRCQTFHNDSGGSSTLRVVSSSCQVPKYGKEFSYSYMFSDDSDIFTGLGTLWTKRKIKTTDNPGTIIIKPHIIPNAGYEFIHLPNQTNMGTRTVEITATLARDKHTNNLITFRDPTNAINELKKTAINKAYEVFSDHSALISSDRNVIRITNASYQFTSENEITLSIEVQYVMERTETQYRALLP
jgi:hypothetical protein